MICFSFWSRAALDVRKFSLYFSTWDLKVSISFLKGRSKVSISLFCRATKVLLLCSKTRLAKFSNFSCKACSCFCRSSRLTVFFSLSAATCPCTSNNFSSICRLSCSKTAVFSSDCISEVFCRLFSVCNAETSLPKRFVEAALPQ